MLFDAIRATTPELLNSSFRLRYQVYCVENRFLDPADHPGGIETDNHDRHSLHALLVHRPTNIVCGTTRLVMPKLGPVAVRLPLFDACPEARKVLPPETTAEFSRFAVSKAFRRRAGDELYGLGRPPVEIDDDRRRTTPHLTLGLMAIALQMGVDYGIDYVCAIMEPSLLRLLSRFGIRFTPIGPMVEYHGLRQPCYADISDLLETMENERPDVWEIVTNCGRARAPTRECDASNRFGMAQV
jgi:N-acyl amino acid synthase of PEP-CTERM/exosortase system